MRSISSPRRSLRYTATSWASSSWSSKRPVRVPSTWVLANCCPVEALTKDTLTRTWSPERATDPSTSVPTFNAFPILSGDTTAPLKGATAFRDMTWSAGTELISLMRDYDCLACPSTVDAAPRGLGWTGSPAFNVPWSLTGLPSVTVPSGMSEDEMPLGLQLVGWPHRELDLLGVAAWCEDVLGFPEGPRDPFTP